MSSRNQTQADTADREITMTRVFDAPRDLVFQMWVDPDHIGHWWGPEGFTLTTYEMDVRPGGVWRSTMHGPDGVNYQNKHIYREIVRPERLVLFHESQPNFQMTAHFEALGDKTKVSIQMLFETAAIRDKTIRDVGAVEGLNQTLNRLARHLATI